MDIVGKVYRDFFIQNSSLDGKSHQISKFEFGGINNIIKKENFLQHYININRLKLQLIINKNIKSEIQNIKTNFSVSYISIDEVIPTALIFDSQGKRTSYVMDDQMINIKRYDEKSKTACIFYADKFYSETFNNYDKMYLDTAGNSYKDLDDLSKNKCFKKDTVISISQEYLTDNLLKNFLKEKKYIVVSHCPTSSELYFRDQKIFIPNEYYVNIDDSSIKTKTTGLGDIFFILISELNYYHQISLEQSIRKAQKIITEQLILNPLKNN